MALILLKGTVIQKATISLLVYEIIVVCASLDASIFSLITGTWSSFAFTRHGYEYLIFRGINAVVIDTVLFVFCYYIRKTRALSSRTSYASFLVLAVLSVLALRCVDTISGYTMNEVVRTVINASIVLINVLVQFIVAREVKSDRVVVALAQEFEYQRQHMDDVKEMDAKLQHIKHDMKNHLQCAVALIAEEKNESAIDYLMKLTDMVSISLTHKHFVDNVAINSVLDSKFTACTNNGIEYDYSITGDIDKISDVDFNIILGNLLDNAIKGCEGCDNKRLHVKIRNEKGYLKIQVENTIAGSVLTKNPNLVSTKSDSASHGIGLKSIEAVAQRYQGFTDFYETGNQFTASVFLQIA